MQLKPYQKRVIHDLKDYLDHLYSDQSLSGAFADFWADRNVKVGVPGVPRYRNIIDGVPNICYKVPTGGGKTFLACASIKPIFDAMDTPPSKAVVWLVPSEAILTQTLRALKDPQHPYRQRLNADFGARVEVYSKAELLAGQNFSVATVADQVSVMVLSYDSFRTSNAEGRKSYQANSALEGFHAALGAPEVPIENADVTALFQIINQLRPLVIVDESHHARSDLSREMLTNFNPSFVLDLTATPTKEANIISYVDAYELKRSHMVKLPVMVYNRDSQKEVIADAIDLRGSLEDKALQAQAAGGDYIRPIVLFQAEPRAKENAATFDKLRDKLTDAGIPAEQIAIKTAQVDELKGVDLLSSQCPIRFIITVNALKEGWDCPFAYVLASLANRTSRVDVEQVLGRVLRQPYTHSHSDSTLNMSFVLTSSSDFNATVENVVQGLNSAGFSANDYRVVESAPDEPEPGTELGPQQTPPNVQQSVDSTTEEDQPDFLGFDAMEVAEELAERDEGPSAPLTDSVSVSRMVEEAEQASHEYDDEVAARASTGEGINVPSDLADHMKSYGMNSIFATEARALRLPQFYSASEGDLFEGSDQLVTKESLTSGFKLTGHDYSLDVQSVAEEMRAVDVRSSNKDRPRAFGVSAHDQSVLRHDLFNAASDAMKSETVTQVILERLSKKFDSVADSDLKTYVRQMMGNLDVAQQKYVLGAPQSVALHVQAKIEGFLTDYRAEVFEQRLDTGQVFAKPTYALPEAITPIEPDDVTGGGLYEVEEAMNGDERELASRITVLENVQWWHRVRDRSEGAFKINGPVNHYPDLIVHTAKGTTILVESKGAQLNNPDSAVKAKLGRQWQQAAGPGFRYYMVFRDGVQAPSGTLTATQFLERLSQL